MLEQEVSYCRGVKPWLVGVAHLPYKYIPRVRQLNLQVNWEVLYTVGVVTCLQHLRDRNLEVTAFWSSFLWRGYVACFGNRLSSDRFNTYSLLGNNSFVYSTPLQHLSFLTLSSVRFGHSSLVWGC